VTTIWKSNSLAVLHALAPDVQSGVGGIQRASALGRQAEGVRVRLEGGGAGWRLRGGER
jgi:hypothetical protein